MFTERQKGVEVGRSSGRTVKSGGGGMGYKERGLDIDGGCIMYLFTSPLFVETLVDLRQRFRVGFAPFLDRSGSRSQSSTGMLEPVATAGGSSSSIAAGRQRRRRRRRPSSVSVVAGAVAGTAPAASSTATASAAAERVHVGPARLGR